MKRHKKHWTKVMFVDKAEMWLQVMNQAWRLAPRTVRGIMKILKEYGITQGKVLELGCGNGRIILNMAKRGFQATGIDISELYIKDAQKKASRMKVKARLIAGDIRQVCKLVQGKFDVVISIWTSIGFYDHKTDQRVFKQVAQLLKKKGVFLILNTMSRERLENIFWPNIYEEAGQYIKLNRNTFDRIRSITHNKWIFYRKAGKDLLYEDEIDFDLRIYALPELVEMGERCGLKFRSAYHSVLTLEPAHAHSPANIVFQKE
jgi:SAM-dependent methyltransferase